MLVDTNVLSELMRPLPDRRVALWASGQQRLDLSAITVEEITFGLSWRSSPRRSRVFAVLLERHARVLPVDEAIARRAGLLRARLASRGRSRTQADMLIAATAAEHDLTLVTRNVRDFVGCGIQLLDPFRG